MATATIRRGVGDGGIGGGGRADASTSSSSSSSSSGGGGGGRSAPIAAAMLPSSFFDHNNNAVSGGRLSRSIAHSAASSSFSAFRRRRRPSSPSSTIAPASPVSIVSESSRFNADRPSSRQQHPQSPIRTAMSPERDLETFPLPQRVLDNDDRTANSSESTPLLLRKPPSPSSRAPNTHDRQFHNVSFWRTTLRTAAASLPAVVLGVMLNVLDSLSYGVIIFPNSPLFPSTAAQAGVSMFLASTVVSQLVFAFGGSRFIGANGSMMIEVMPFLHMIAKIIDTKASESATKAEVVATVMIAYAISTILTGIAFLVLGAFRLGSIVSFFPRHILVGCIGGIGWFLFVTGIEITTAETPAFSTSFLWQIFTLPKLVLWGSALLLALCLKGLQLKIDRKELVPLFYVSVPIIFYIGVWIAGVSLDSLRKWGILFELPSADSVPFYEFYTYFNGFRGVAWNTIPATIPTQLALVFFSILHVPINVPALAVSTKTTVDINREIFGHGISNLLAGLIGTPQNYLVYANSLLFIRSGGDSFVGSILLAAATSVVWIFGGDAIGYVPKFVIGSLIFHLAIDLMKESLWDIQGTGISKVEFGTIALIVLTMAVLGFTEGIAFGLFIACLFFVITYSRRSVIRATLTGSEVRSSILRPLKHQQFLDQVGSQTRILQLQGFLFFGVVQQLESAIAQFTRWDVGIQFLVLDFALVSGLDYSILDAFRNFHRQIQPFQIQLVYCEMAEHILTDLTAGGVLDPTVVLLRSLTQALEYTENQLLMRLFEFRPEESKNADDSNDPVETLLLSFFGTSDNISLSGIANYFTRCHIGSGQLIWNEGDDDGGAIMIVEAGEASVITATGKVTETLLPGTMVGEIEVFSRQRHPATLVAGEDGGVTVWKMTADQFNVLGAEDPGLCIRFMRAALRFDCMRTMRS